MENNDIIFDLLRRIINIEKDIEFLKQENVELKIMLQKQSGSKIQSNNFTPNMINQNYTVDVKTNFSTQSENTRDKTRYMFNGTVYLKNRLVLAIISDYVKNHNDITRSILQKVFDKSLQGSIGVIEFEETAKQRKDYTIRYFSKENEQLNLVDGIMYVCSQWGCLNIPRFIARARELGYKIEEV